MKKMHAPTSNPNFNIPMTETQWDIVDFIIFESETALKYPFKVSFDDLTMEQIDEIIKCCKELDDTESIYCACEKVLGTVEN